MKNIIKFHHIGKPVTLNTIRDNPETKYSELYDMYSLDVANNLSLPIELHAFGPHSSLDKRIQTMTHVAFTVTNLDESLQGNQIIMPRYTPFKDYSCAMILLNDQPVELIETTLSEREIWGDGIFKDSILYPNKN
ncbi:hypothetical protein [Liquorilactobacillus capillatus]|uniref:Uncharacterized protein n=1 Tax=Liquorilactobacillus capillatus DSM 19910 TaxID=1423731 RepID=A0A0R1LZU3_9LACO|nr:hypothetical protein [Liquorilactobacillus capillatus]KRL01159.1 hypothetical protein FC81_GL001299 [Liquorilactobacillus capillatus DSM 19910]